MDHTPPDRPSPEPSDGSGPESVSEEEVNDVLAEASSLAAELARQLDADERPDAPEAGGDFAPESTKLEQQIEDVDALLAHTRNELNDQPSTEPSPTAPRERGDEPSPESRHAPASNAIPNFMDEFTHPVEEPPRPQPAAHKPSAGAPSPQSRHGAVVDPKPGIVRTGVIGAPADQSAVSSPSSRTESRTATPPRRAWDPRAWPAGVAKRLAAATPMVVAHLYPAAEKAVAIIEKTDRPFTWMKFPIRRAVGWLAIATLGTSALVFLWSLA